MFRLNDYPFVPTADGLLDLRILPLAVFLEILFQLLLAPECEVLLFLLPVVYGMVCLSIAGLEITQTLPLSLQSIHLLLVKLYHLFGEDLRLLLTLACELPLLFVMLIQLLLHLFVGLVHIHRSLAIIVLAVP